MIANPKQTQAPDGDGGARESLNQLMKQLQAEVRAIARRRFAREDRGHTLQATALVSELYIRMADQANVEGMTHEQFLRVAGNVIRRILIDHARMKDTEKRGGDWTRVTIDDGKEPAGVNHPLDLLVLDEMLEKLAKQCPRRTLQVVECRIFSNMSGDEIAASLGVSRRSINYDLDMAKAWFSRHDLDTVKAWLSRPQFGHDEGAAFSAHE